MTTHSIQSVIAMLEKSRWTSICKLADLKEDSALIEEITTDMNNYEFDGWKRLFQLGVTRHDWIGPYISIHFLSLNPLLVRRRRYSRGERYPSALCGCHSL